MTSAMWINLLTPIVGPILTALAKKIQPKIPTWLIPIIAVLLGAGTNLLGSAAVGVTPELPTALALGLAGIGVRETTQRLNPAVREAEKKATK